MVRPSPERIQQLRVRTGAGIMDAKRALVEAEGDLTRAETILRERGAKVAQAKQERTTREGQIGFYVHSNGKVGALVALACETDFVARTEDFSRLAHDLALHVTAAQPKWLAPEDVPADVVAAERDLYAKQAAREKKPAAVREKIMNGKLEKFYEETCLLKQRFVKDDSLSVEGLLQQAVAKLGENIKITGFNQLALG